MEVVELSFVESVSLKLTVILGFIATSVLSQNALHISVKKKTPEELSRIVVNEVCGGRGEGGRGVRGEDGDRVLRIFWGGGRWRRVFEGR